MNFAAVSHFSMAFHDADTGTDSYGDFVTPQTASVAIDVTGTNHGAIIGLVCNLFAGSDPISENFRFSNLLAYSTGPWAANQYNAYARSIPAGSTRSSARQLGQPAAPAAILQRQHGAGGVGDVVIRGLLHRLTDNLH